VYNDHTHWKGNKGSSSGGCCYSSLGISFYFPLGSSGSPDSGFPQQVGYVRGCFPLVLGYYCFIFSLCFWHYSIDRPDVGHTYHT
jgi:hypothetical protein